MSEESGIRKQDDKKSVEEASKLPTRLIYEVIRRDGDEELERPVSSLLWSGIAAGLMISFSVLGEAVFRARLPDQPWRVLVENLGYSLGFLLVILGRMQLFTENTIKTVLPLMARPDLHLFRRVLRLWSIVLAANVVGAFVAAAFFAYTAALPASLLPAIEELSRHAVMTPPAEGFARAIPAGILIAAIVWMGPQAKASEFFTVLAFTWLIAAGDFTHIVAGSVEMAYLALNGVVGFGQAAFGFFLPVLAGNIVGGTAIFTLLAWGQVREELAAKARSET